MRRIIEASFMVVILAILGCQQSDSRTPHDIYMAFHQMEIEGKSFEEKKKYMSAEAQAKSQTAIDELVKKGKSKEKILTFFRKFSQNVAKCSQLKLEDTKINGNKAEVIYLYKDTCSNKENNDFSKKITVKMIKENYWKIVSVDTQL